MAGNQEFEQFKSQLTSQILSIVGEGHGNWERILSDQELCTEIISEQVIVNHKFWDYHEIWMESSFPDDIATFHRFNEIDEEVNSLGDILEGFELRSQAAIEMIKKLLISFQDKLKYINEVKEFVQSCNVDNLNQLQTIHLILNEFEWLDLSILPNVIGLSQEWSAIHLYQRITSCVDQMSQLFVSSNNNLNLPEYITENSSSSQESLEIS